MQIIFSLIPKFYEKNAYIIKENTYSDKLLMIENGIVEIFTYFEGNKFIIENLGTGAIINYRNFFIEDKVQINLRCVTNVNLVYTDLESFQKIALDNNDLQH